MSDSTISKIDIGEVRTHCDRAASVLALAKGLEGANQRSISGIRVAFDSLRSEMIRRELQSIPVARLKDATGGRLRLGNLERAGYSTVLQVYDASPRDLLAIPGVGEQTAMHSDKVQPC